MLDFLQSCAGLCLAIAVIFQGFELTNLKKELLKLEIDYLNNQINDLDNRINKELEKLDIKNE